MSFEIFISEGKKSLLDVGFYNPKKKKKGKYLQRRAKMKFDNCEIRTHALSDHGTWEVGIKVIP